MADTKLSSLANLGTTPSADDEFYIVTDTGTTPVSKSVKYSDLNIGGAAGTLAQTLTLGSTTGGNDIVISQSDKLDFTAAASGQVLMTFPSSAQLSQLAGVLILRSSTFAIETTAGLTYAQFNQSGNTTLGASTIDASIELYNSGEKLSISSTALTSARAVTLPDADVDFTGGATENILTQQANGDWQPQSRTVNGVSPTSGDVSIDLDDISNGSVRQIYTESDAEDAGKKQGTAFPLTPNDYEKFFRTDIGMMFFYDQSRAKWLSDYTREIHWYSANTTSGTGTQSLLSGGNDREYLVGNWTLVGLVMGNQANGFNGDVAITDAAASGASVYDETGIVGGVNNFLINTNVTANARINVDVNSTGSSTGLQRPMVTLILKKLES